jgi:hypothetical protein
MRRLIETISTQLSIDEALQFVGDNGPYQRRRLLVTALIVFAHAILSTRATMEEGSLPLLFLIASGAGQIVCPIKLSVRTCGLGVGGAALLAMGLHPFGGFFKVLGLMGVGFFSRGFFIASLIYLTEIGGDRFQAWSMLVVFGLWGLSSLFTAVDQSIGLEGEGAYYLLVFLPCLLGSYLVLDNWQLSPRYFYFKCKR